MGEGPISDRSDRIARLVARLDRATDRPGGWLARCPAHDDDRPSLSLSTGKAGAVLLHCHAGCSPEDVVAALGLTMADLFEASTPKPHLRIAATYDYQDEGGGLLYQVCRYDPKDFRARRPNGGGGWAWNLRGVRKVLYRLPELVGATRGSLIFVVEGEKDADRLATLGLTSTTNSGGAGKWRPEYTDVLQGQRIVVIGDHDEAGQSHARDVADAVARVAASVQILTLPDLDGKGDVSDWLDAGGTLEALLALAAAMPHEVPSACLTEGERAQSISAVESDPFHAAQTSLSRRAARMLPFRTAREFAAATPSDVHWIAQPYVAAGAITGVEGKIKVAGKTTFVTHMCRAVLDGRPFLGQPTRRTGVVYLTEQPSSSLREALRRADLLERDDFTILSWRDCMDLDWSEVVDAAVSECQRRGAGLLVVDTLGRFAGIRGDGENSAGEAEAAMAPLQAAAADGLAVIVVRHERKAGGEVGDSGRGSSAFGGAVDIVMAVRRGEGGTPTNVRIIHALSRYDETPDTLGVELTADGYVALGDTVAIAQRRAEASLLGVLPTDLGHGLSMDDLVNETGSTRTTIQLALDALATTGLVAREGAGRKGYRYRWSARPSEGPSRVQQPSDPGSERGLLPWLTPDDADDWVMGTA